MSNGSVPASGLASDFSAANITDGEISNSSTVTEVSWTGTEWVTKYENETVNSTVCPVYVHKVHILANPWDDATWVLTSAFVIFTMQSGMYDIVRFSVNVVFFIYLHRNGALNARIII